MKSNYLILYLLAGTIMYATPIIAQPYPDSIYSPVTINTARETFKQTLVEKTILQTFRQPLNNETEYDYESALWGITQFLLSSSEIKKGIDKLYNQYNRLQNSTRQSLLEATYAVYPKEYESIINKLIEKEKELKLFAMQAAYLVRSKPVLKSTLLHLLMKQFKNNANQLLYQQTALFLTPSAKQSTKLPSLTDLFEQQQTHGLKVIYSFQRKNRDYTGLAIVQFENGRFAKDENGHLKTFVQLARSASALPYFITNGNTPQGIYSIQGTDKSKNTFIGPTPNIQLVMPNEVTEFTFFHQQSDTSNYIADYKKLLPASWQNYTPVYESFTAGKIGRTEIIAHGTTIDPSFFSNKPYYPVSPTLGCLCAREIWNEKTGHLQQSDMYELTQTFLSTPGNKGYLIVINLDDQSKPVSIEEVEKIVKEYENKNARH